MAVLTKHAVLTVVLVFLPLLNLALATRCPETGCADADAANLMQVQRDPMRKLSSKNLKDSAIIVIDMQNDFAHPNGTLSFRGVNEDVVKPINELLGLDWGLRIFTADNHPHNHVSFATNHPVNAETLPNGPFPVVPLKYTTQGGASGHRICGVEYMERYGEAGALCNGFPGADGVAYSADATVGQETYPPHCVQGTWGQKIHEKVKFSYDDPDDHLILKGATAHIDSYSAVFNNVACAGEIEMDAERHIPLSKTCVPTGKSPPRETNLPDLLYLKGVKDVYFVGLCLDYCVKYSSIHTAMLSAKTGWNTYVVQDATRSCGLPFHADHSIAQMEESGVKLIQMDSIFSH